MSMKILIRKILQERLKPSIDWLLSPLLHRVKDIFSLKIKPSIIREFISLTELTPSPPQEGTPLPS